MRKIDDTKIGSDEMNQLAVMNRRLFTMLMVMQLLPIHNHVV